MSNVDHILSAAAGLDPDELVTLREELSRLEERLWQDELAKTSEELRAAHATDEHIDRIVTRQRLGQASAETDPSSSG